MQKSKHVSIPIYRYNIIYNDLEFKHKCDRKSRVFLSRSLYIICVCIPIYNLGINTI